MSTYSRSNAQEIGQVGAPCPLTAPAHRPERDLACIPMPVLPVLRMCRGVTLVWGRCNGKKAVWKACLGLGSLQNKGVDKDI